jgi:four helix bundle protein
MDLKKFEIYSVADELSELIWEEVRTWSIFNKDTVGKQIVRSADSVSANLAEAVGRFSFWDRKRFAYYSRGSLTETYAWLKKCQQRGLIEGEKCTLLMKRYDSLGRMLNAYINRMKTGHKS